MKIETHNLIKRYGEKTVVNDVNVEVEQGRSAGSGLSQLARRPHST